MRGIESFKAAEALAPTEKPEPPAKQEKEAALAPPANEDAAKVEISAAAKELASEKA